MFPEISQWLAENGHGEVLRTSDTTTNRGCHYARLHLSSRRTVFLKHNSSAPETMYHAEAEGLRALDTITDVRVPEVLHVTPDYILMEDIGDLIAIRDRYSECG